MLLGAEQKIFKMDISSEPAQIHKVEEMLERFFSEVGLDREDIENLGIATTEIVNNAIHHGNRDDFQKKVHIEFKIDRRRVEISIRDDGNGFNPENVADPLEPENMFKENGRGIFIVKSLMDDIQYHFSPQGTQVVLIKYI
jgi:serine/threonine-protein kinase RsbW